MQIPDPKNDQSKVAGSAQSTASPLDKYTVAPKQPGGDGGEKKGPYYQSQAPGISLPKGGGALKGIDEKFTVNAVNGTASLEVPLPLTQGRGEFTPKLSLQYNSGSGNSEFGLGWSLSLSSIQRKTDKKLPQYNDAGESDVFLMSGAEDLQPLLVADGDDWVHEVFDTSDGFRIKRYRPRIEGLFARIEYISKIGALDSRPWWKVTTKDNVVTFYGLTEEARIADPENENRIFKWLPQLSYDNKGNAMLYTYVTDNTTDIVPDAPHERNRKSGSAKFTNTYLAHVAYCNRTPYIPDASATHVTAPILPEGEDFLMRCLFDYGGHDTYITDIEPVNDIPARADAFSDFHAGFEVRTYRRCFRVVMLHYFDELDGGDAVVVKSLDIQYHVGTTPLTWEDADQVTSVTLKAYQKTGATTYDVKSLPPMAFEYSALEWSKNVREFSSDLIENMPQGLTGPYQWIDLWGEGLPGILTEQAGAWYYMQSSGTGRFYPAVAVAEKPSFQGFGSALQWQDLDADGRRQLVSRNSAMPGYFELDDDQQWQSFRPFRDWINVNWDSPYTHMLDLNGDGRPDLLITEEQAWRWYENEGKDGFTEGGNGAVANDEELGPRMLHHDAIQTIFLADINGDGLTDLVRILNGEICYWPNMGYGRFGARVTMTNSPLFDSPENFNPRRVILADLTGTGAVDLLYFGDDFCNAWLNLAGNAWAQPRSMPFFGGLDQFGKVTVCDFYGNGTSCIVWSSSSLQSSSAPLRVVYLMGQEGKPYLMKACHNHMGKRTEITYLRSTIYYLQHRYAGIPWATRLPFPVHCVASQTIKDTVSQTQYTTSYSYHHGYYDHEEREFRGFGRVDTTDTELAESTLMGVETYAPLQQKPVKTKTWYHTGAWMRDKTLIDAFLDEYTMLSWAELPVGAGSAAYLDMPSGLSAQEQREAYRALKGMPLRQEVYAIDETELTDVPYAVTTNIYCVKKVQPLAGNKFASFHAYKQQTISYSCEREVDDARVQHELTLSMDEYGNVLRAAKVTYPRSASAIATGTGTGSLPLFAAGKQAESLITFTDTGYTNDSDGYIYLLRLPCDVQTYQLTGASPGSTLWGVDELDSAIDGASLIAWTDVPGLSAEKRVISHARTTYLDSVANVLDLGVLEDRTLVYRQYNLAITEDMLLASGYYDGRVSEAMLEEGGYVREDNIVEFVSADDTRFWLQGGHVVYLMTNFCTPSAYLDPWGNATTITWWDDAGECYYLVPHSVTDALGNVTTANAYNWYNLQPTQITDINNNESHILYDTLGLPTAIAIMEKDGSVNGDTLTGIDPLAEATLADNFFNDPVTYAGDVLQGATWRCLYRFGDEETPSCVAMLARELHNSEDPDSPSLVRFTYTDGLGRVAMSKVQGAPEEGETDIQWIASGKTVYNNKGNVVLQYEPYYTASHEYDNALLAATMGVSPKMYYDALGRLERTELPDGSFTKTKWAPWANETYDNNDTVIGSEWAARRTAPSGDLSSDANEVDAREKTEYHNITPTVVHFDTLGRPICTIQRNSIPDPTDPPNWMYELYTSHVVLDIVGNRVEIEDARELTAHTYTSNMLGAVACHVSMDGGTQYLLADAAGQPLYAWDPLDSEFHFTYDDLRRRLTKEVTPSGSSTKVLERTVYGEGATDDYDNNLRGQPIKLYDGCGTIDFEVYDFKGAPLSSARTYAVSYIEHIDWTTPGSVSMETDVYTTSMTYDALGRQVAVTTPDDAVTSYVYNETGLLFSVDVEDAGGTLTTDIVNEIYYNARGQRIKIKYYNGATTTYTYDAETFRVRRIRTTRSTDSAVLQDLNYWYDPVGNITMQTDDAQQDVYYDNTVAEPTNDYTYDALYRLIICEGREHAGSNSPVNYGDSTRMGHNPLPTDASAMRRYTQYYFHDEVGNMLKMQHVTSGSGSWTRQMPVDTASNRIDSSTIGSTGSSTESYTHDARGNLVLGMNSLYAATLPDYATYYNEENRLQKLVMADASPVYYQYDQGGQRTRKVKLVGSYTHVWIYIGQWEVYRKINGSTLELERESLHIMDDTARVAVIDTPLTGAGSEVQTLRYQLSNHLGTATLELAYDADVISYEEYYPFGNTSYQGGRTVAECSLKRYRYVGKERDNESGFYYMGARYYCPWLARWLEVDPINDEWYNMCQGNPTRNAERQFVELTASSYEYCYANPVRFTDPSGEQAIDTIKYVGSSAATKTTGTNPTPAELPKFIWSNAKPGNQLDGKSAYYQHVPGGWQPANVGMMHGSANPQTMEKYGLYTAAGAAKADSTFNSQMRLAQSTDAVKSWNNYAISTNPFGMLMQAANTTIVKPGSEVLQNAYSGNYVEAGVGMAMFFPIGRLEAGAASILHNIRALSTIGETRAALKGVHSFDDVMAAGQAFVGKGAIEVYAPQSGRFIGWESKDGLRRFRPPAEKSGFGIEANFEQRVNNDVSWGKQNTEASRSNMHVETSQKFDYFSMQKSN